MDANARNTADEAVIRVVGAAANNLRNVTVDLPKKALTVVTGVSGSGKSSLVLDTASGVAPCSGWCSPGSVSPPPGTRPRTPSTIRWACAPAAKGAASLSTSGPCADGGRLLFIGPSAEPAQRVGALTGCALVAVALTGDG
ncbi:hypothetical protein ACFY40_08455 [Streptomyces sp. NPDC012950]|uniref:hypothetical protein n=1 Tax=Streptomyces sp. NPDC012950 TaxID=3364858 RepID=UPI00369E2091